MMFSRIESRNDNLLSRCKYAFGRNNEAIQDGMKAVEKNSNSINGHEVLGNAFYASGLFEKALVQFHRAFRQAKSNCDFF